MKNLYNKNQLIFSLIWIALYVILLSLADKISDSLGIHKVLTAPLCLIMTVVISAFIYKNGLGKKYGFSRPTDVKRMFLWYLPLGLIASTNLWFGIKITLTTVETILAIISMILVGFLEEVIFRGFLFKSLEKDNVKMAIIVSSVTFGMGHIINLLNGQDFLGTLAQICYAISIGFLFTIMVYKGGSIWPCIITHSLVNSLSVIGNHEARTPVMDVLIVLFLCIVPVFYSIYILKKANKREF